MVRLWKIQKTSNHRSRQDHYSIKGEESTTSHYTLLPLEPGIFPGQVCWELLLCALCCDSLYQQQALLATLSPERTGLCPQVSGALTFPVSSPGTRGLRKRFLSTPGMMGSSLSFTGKSSFLSLWATTRDIDSNAVTVPDQGTSLPSHLCFPAGMPSTALATMMGQQHKVLGSCAENTSLHQCLLLQLSPEI